MGEPVVQGAVLQEGQMRCYCRCMPSMHSSEVLLAAHIRLRAQGSQGIASGRRLEQTRNGFRQRNTRQ